LEDLFCEMVLCPELLDLLDQFLLRMLNMDLVKTFRAVCARLASLAGFVAITLFEVSQGTWLMYEPVDAGQYSAGSLTPRKEGIYLCSSLLTLHAGIMCHGLGDPSMFGGNFPVGAAGIGSRRRFGCIWGSSWCAALSG
jgi:hypothetical protein